MHFLFTCYFKFDVRGIAQQGLKYTPKTKDTMANFLKSHICNSMVAYLTIASFSTTLLVPPPLMALDINAINFGIKMEKIVEKVKKAIDKGETNKLVGYMFDFKQEVEQYTGQKIDINKSIDQLKKKRGLKAMTKEKFKSKKFP